jgi:hypothetical protein
MLDAIGLSGERRGQEGGVTKTKTAQPSTAAANADSESAEAADRPRARLAPAIDAPPPGGLRREQMLGHIKEREFVRVTELSDRFAISDVTVRSDLAALALRGLIRRVHGGAMPRAVPGQEQPFEEVETHSRRRRSPLVRPPRRSSVTVT